MSTRFQTKRDLNIFWANICSVGQQRDKYYKLYRLFIKFKAIHAIDQRIYFQPFLLKLTFKQF